MSPQSTGPEPEQEAEQAVPGLVSSTRTRGGRSKLRRRVSGMLVLVMALVGAGFLASALTPNAQVAVAQDNTTLAHQGKQLYENACITCHGTNLQGVDGRGPSLIGVGDAAVFFQVSSGRMPAVRNEAQAQRKKPKFSLEQTDQLGAYIEANGGGPETPRDANGQAATTSLIGNNTARGADLFRLNCASCHNFVGKGGALASGRYAPALAPASEAQIYTAMLSGPQSMPKFSDRQLTPTEKKDIIAYVKSATTSTAPGGYDLGGIGPVSEGLIMWIVGVVALIGVTLWAGAKA